MRCESVANVGLHPRKMPQDFSEQMNQRPRALRHKPRLNLSFQKPIKSTRMQGEHQGQTREQSRTKGKPVKRNHPLLNCSGFYRRIERTMLAAWVLAIVFLSCSSSANVVPINNLDLATLASPTGFKLLGSTQYGWVGYCVSSAGDVNGDGFDDILVGEPRGGVQYSFSDSSTGKRYYNYYSGVVYVIFGHSNSTPFDNINLSLMVTGPKVGYRINGREDSFSVGLGFSVNKAGDFNGDGIGDIIVGSNEDTPGGSAYVLFGNKNSSYAADVNLQSMITGRYTGFRVFGTSSGEYIGSAVSSAGDINGDGVDDIIVGARSYSNFAGATFVLFGRRVYTNVAAFTNVNLATFAFTATTGFRVSGYRNGATEIKTGWSTSRAGDVNNDGVADMIICGWNSVAHVVYGRNTTGNKNLFTNMALLDWVTTNSTGFRVIGVGLYAVSSADDINGDGISDIIVGTSRYSYSMAAYVIFGRDARTRGAFVDIYLQSFISGPTVGFQVVGGPVYLGSEPDATASFVRSAGDVNGDGISDVIIGFQYGDIRFAGSTTRTNSGITYVLFGRNTTLTGLAFTDINATNFRADIYTGFCIYGAHYGALGGSSVSGAGDINNDGFGDIIVGSYKDKGPGTSTGFEFGAAYVIYGANYIPTPTAAPTFQPTRLPTRKPTFMPTKTPISKPTAKPTIEPTAGPSQKPSSLPSSQPSDSPSSQPSAMPSTQPSTQPISLPTSCPSTQPTGLPSVQPTCLPTTQPTSQPSSMPSTQPTSLPTLAPSTQPSSHPTSQPSTQPTTLPSAQPTTLPTAAPSTQPTAQPSMQPLQWPTSLPTALPLPTSQPSTHPSAQLTTQPSAQPSVQPSGQPTCMPSRQPSAQPSAQPSSPPSTLPTAAPTTTSSWFTLYGNSTLHRLSTGPDTVWACGEEKKATCVVLDAHTGAIHEQYMFGWDRIAFVMAVREMQMVFVGGTTTAPQSDITGPTLRSVTGACSYAATGTTTDITCTVNSYADVVYAHSSYSTFANRVLYVGKTHMHAAAMIVDPTVTSAAARKSYLYSAAIMKSIMLQFTGSPQRFVGSMVVGTAVSVGNMHCIIAGWINLETGTMSAVYLTPVTGTILGSDSLVTGMVVEPLGPDMFIVGGMEQTADSRGTCAYLIRDNALYRSLKYSVRYVTSDAGARRSLRGNAAHRSVCRGVVQLDDYLFVLLDYSTPLTNVSVVLRVFAETGNIMDQATISAQNASVTCTDIVASTNSFLHIACAVRYTHSAEPQGVIISTTTDLRFSHVPQGFLISRGNHTLRAESVPFSLVYLPVTKQSMAGTTTGSTLVPTNQAPTYRPTVPPTPHPTLLPTVAPSTQPTSTPTITPSVSPQPTSLPSTSGPTNTYKPISTPTAKPTYLPTIQTTAHPSAKPTTQPTLRPSHRPTLLPTTHPTAISSVKPTTFPTAGTTQRPSTVRTIRPTRGAPSAQPSASGADVQQDSSVGTDGAGSSRIMYIVFASFGGTVCLLFFGSTMWKVYSHRKEKSSQRKRRMAYDRAYAGLQPRWFSSHKPSHKTSAPAHSVPRTPKKKSASVKKTQVVTSAYISGTTGGVADGGICSERNMIQTHVGQTPAENNPNEKCVVETIDSRDSSDSLYDEILREGSDYSYSMSESE